MPITKQKKEDIVAVLSEKLKTAKSTIFVSFSGLTVSDANALRNRCRKESVAYFVAKKSLMKIACEQAGISLNPKSFVGEIAVAFGENDEVVAAKILAEFIKKTSQIQFVQGVLDQKVLSAEEVASLAKIPSKPELLAKLLGSLNSPISGFVNTLTGNLRNLVGVLHAISKVK